MSSSTITNDQFDILYHMVLDALVRVTAVENLLMSKTVTTEEEIQAEIAIVAAHVKTAVESAMTDPNFPTAIGLENTIPNYLPSLHPKKSDPKAN